MGDWVPPMLGGGGSSVDTRKLQYSVNAQRNRAKTRNLNPPNPNSPTTISRVFDVLSRANYAVANLYKDAGEAGSKGELFNPLDSLWEGLSGRKKVTFSDVITDIEKRHDVKVAKPVKAVAGLGLDIGFDPTTYFGIGVLKKAKPLSGPVENALERGTAAVAAQAFNKPATVQKAMAEAKQFSKSMTSDDLASMLKQGVYPNTKQQKVMVGSQKKIEKTLAAQFRIREAIDSAALARKEAEGKVVLKFLGKPVGSSEALYKAIPKTMERLRKTSTGGKLLDQGKKATDAISGLFRLSHHLPGYTRIAYLTSHGSNFANYQDSLKELSTLAREKGLKETDLEAITRAIDKKTVDALDPNLQEFALEMKKGFADMADWEVQKGILKPEQILDNYVTHIYKNEKVLKELINKGEIKLKTPSYVKEFGVENASFSKHRKLDSIERAEAFGLEPELNILRIYAHRLHKHMETRTRAEFIEKLGESYGLKLGTSKLDKETAKQLKALGYSNKHSAKTLDENTWLPYEAHDIINRLKEFHSRSPEAEYFGRNFDRIQHAYKTVATVIRPGFHTRNLASDTMMAYLGGGVKTAQPFEFAAKVLLDDLKPITDGTRASWKVGNTQIPTTEILSRYKALGGRTGVTRTELQAFDAVEGGNSVMDKIRGFSEYREEFVRIAHFADALKKNVEAKGMSLDRAAEQAMQQVQKWHVNYASLTPFEKNVAKRIVPFYTWTSRNLVNTLELALTQPGRLATIPKTKLAVQEMLGTPADVDPNFPGEEEVVPKWIREMAPIRLSGEGQVANPIFFTMQTPFEEGMDFIPTTDSGNFDVQALVGQRLLAATTPAIRIPYELASGKTAFTGGPRRKGWEYAISQIPSGTIAKNAMDADSTKLIEGIGPLGNQDFINMLTGAGLRRVTDTDRNSELRRQQQTLKQLIAEYNKNRENAKLLSPEWG